MEKKYVGELTNGLMITENQKEPEIPDIAADIAVGGVFGGVVGLIAGVGALINPGIGLMLPVDASITTLAGLLVGAGAGGFIGVMLDKKREEL